jgi:hypothetical protein
MIHFLMGNSPPLQGDLIRFPPAKKTEVAANDYGSKLIGFSRGKE